MSTELIIDVRALSKRFDDKVVVDHIDLQVKRGEVFGFLGPNGSGKTTTIRMLCGLLKPDSGRGTCLGFDVLTQSYEIKKQVGYMTQKFSLYAELSIEENLTFIAAVYGVKQQRAAVKYALDQLGLFDRRKQLTAHLSGGWKQRLALAACLIHKPALLLLDEPTAGVDPLARREFWDHIHLLSNQGVTVFVSTHYMDEAERCTRIAYLATGKLLISGTVPFVIEQTQLKAWDIVTRATPSLLQELKKIRPILQCGLASGVIHLCAYDVEAVEENLRALALIHHFDFRLAATRLEDAFICLVDQAGAIN